MRKIVLSALVVALALLNTSCNSKKSSELDPGTIATKEVPVTGYSIMLSALPISVVYEQKDAPAYLRMEIDQSILDKVNIEVKDSVLFMKMKTGISKDLDLSKSVIYTNSKYLKRVSVTGASNLTFKGVIKAKLLDVRIEGAGNFEADSIDCTSFTLTTSGAGDAVVKGKVEAASYNISGAGKLNASDLAVQRLRVFASGAGDATVNASDYLYAIISGAGNVKYIGKPKTLDYKVSGSGKFEQE